MLPFKLVYSEDYFLPIGAHVFPAQKYRLIHKRLLESGLAEAADFLQPQPASDQDILLVHTSDYVNKLKTGTLSAAEEMTMEIPFSPELVRVFWLSAGGSILAAGHAQTPPETALANVVAAPADTVVAPVMLPALDDGLTVTVVVAKVPDIV